MAVGKSPKNSQLLTGTHKGRSTRTKSSASRYGSRPTPLGISATGLKADPRETSALLTAISPVPSGPEPGHGGTTY